MALEDESYKGADMHPVHRAENQVVLAVTVSACSPFYGGHFDGGIKLLPAVAQIDLVVHAIRRYLDEDFLPGVMPKAKFSAPIKPEMPLLLAIQGKDGTYSFRFEDAQKKVYAKGKVCRG